MEDHTIHPTQPSPPHSTPHPQPPPQQPSPSPSSPITQIPTQSNPSKIPIRPQKIRKLSSSPTIGSPINEPNPQSTIAEADASKAIIISTTPTTTTINNNNNNINNNNNNNTTTSTKTRRRNPSSITIPKVIKPLSTPGEISAALTHLRSVDPRLADVIDNHPPPTFDSNQPPFLALTKSILYQQLAFKAGTSIYTRFVNLCGGENCVVPETVLGFSPQQLKQIGVSGRKASYLYDLANKYNNGILSDELVVKMDDRSLFTMLSMVKGIGSWSVHMFMIFSLHRPDVLPVSDLGVRKGVQLLNMLDELPRPSQMEELCGKWRPYRSVGAWYMWRFVEGKGGSGSGAAAAGLVSNEVIRQQQLGQSEQAQQQQQEQQQQLQLQLLEPINSIGNLGACIW